MKGVNEDQPRLALCGGQGLFRVAFQTFTIVSAVFAAAQAPLLSAAILVLGPLGGVGIRVVALKVDNLNTVGTFRLLIMVDIVIYAAWIIFGDVLLFMILRLSMIASIAVISTIGPAVLKVKDQDATTERIGWFQNIGIMAGLCASIGYDVLNAVGYNLPQYLALSALIGAMGLTVIKSDSWTSDNSKTTPTDKFVILPPYREAEAYWAFARALTQGTFAFGLPELAEYAGVTGIGWLFFVAVLFSVGGRRLASVRWVKRLLRRRTVIWLVFALSPAVVFIAPGYVAITVVAVWVGALSGILDVYQLSSAAAKDDAKSELNRMLLGFEAGMLGSAVIVGLTDAVTATLLAGMVSIAIIPMALWLTNNSGVGLNYANA